MNTTIGLSNVKLQFYWEKAEENAQDILAKIELLRNFKSWGISILQYPSGMPLATIKKLCRGIENEKIKSFPLFDSLTIDAGHQTLLHLIRNKSLLHSHYEKFQQKTGGILSETIVDLGEFRLVYSDEEDNIIDGADFSMYRTRDDFVI